MDLKQQEQEPCAYADLVMARHLAHQAHALEGHALQVLNVFMLANTLSIALTGFIRNLEAHVFALMQSALPNEAEDYGLVKKGKTDK